MTQNRRGAAPRTRGTSTSAETVERLAEFKPHNGQTTLFIKGRPAIPILREVGGGATPDSGGRASVDGLQLYRLSEVDLGWVGPTESDFRSLDRRLEALVAADAEAMFIAVVPVDPPAWWLEAQPEERVKYAVRPEAGEHDVKAVSWASTRWRKEAGEALTRLVRHVGQSSWRKRCLGFQIEAGAHGAWLYPALERIPDIGPRMTDAFKRFALEKYRHNTGLLRKAWFDTRAEFDSISCPGAADRAKADYGAFRNPHLSRRVLDYLESLSGAQNEAALHFCRLAKQASGGQTLVGLTRASATDTLRPESGYLFPETLIDSEHVDFFADAKAAGSGGPSLPTSGSLTLRHKFLFRSAPETGSGPSVVAKALVEGVGGVLAAEVSPDLVVAGQSALKRTGKAHKSAAQIAVIIDPAGSQYLVDSPTSRSLGPKLLVEQFQQLDLLGAPYDTYSLADLFQSGLPDYKVTLFVNAFYLSEAERRRVDARVKRSGQTAIWLWAPGVVGEEGVRAEYGERCCGQKIRLEAGGVSLRARIVEPNDALTWGHHIGETFGDETTVNPVVTVVDKQATRLGANTANKTTFSVRRFDTWTSVVYGAAPVPAALLKNLLKAANCHLYAESLRVGDALTVTAGAIALSSRAGGDYKVSLPGVHDVLDAWTGKSQATHVSEFSVKLTRGATGYYELRPHSHR